jgi:hypothetical protein
MIVQMCRCVNVDVLICKSHQHNTQNTIINHQHPYISTSRTNTRTTSWTQSATPTSTSAHAQSWTREHLISTHINNTNTQHQCINIEHISGQRQSINTVIHTSTNYQHLDPSTPTHTTNRCQTSDTLTSKTSNTMSAEEVMLVRRRVVLTLVACTWLEEKMHYGQKKTTQTIFLFVFVAGLSKIEVQYNN